MNNYPTLYESLKKTAKKFPDKRFFESLTTVGPEQSHRIKAGDAKFKESIKKIKEKLPFLKKKQLETKVIQKVTFSEMKEKVDSTASFLWKKGIRSGDWRQDVRNVDRVALMAEPSVEFIQLLLALAKIGAIAVVLNPELKEGLKTTLWETDPKLIFAKDELDPKQTNAIEDLNIPLMNFDIPQTNAQVKVNKDAHAPAAILRTSGTMGQPSLPALSHTNLTSNVRGAMKHIPIDETDIFLSIGRWFHMFPLMSTLLVPMTTGAKVSYTSSSVNLETIAQQVKPTLLFGVPRMYNIIYKKKILKDKLGKLIAEPPLPSFLVKPFQHGLAWLVGRKTLKSFGGNLRFSLSGTAPISIKIARFLRRARVLVLEGYGLSETSPVVAAPIIKGKEKPQTFWQKLFHKIFPFIPYHPNVKKLGSVGKVLPIFSYEQRARNENEAEVLTLKGPSVFMGYWTRDGLDRSDFDEDGFFYTGDVVTIDSDQDVFIRGREDRMISLPLGKNVHPERLERKLRHIEEIEDLIIRPVRSGGEFQRIQALVYPNWDYIKEELDIEHHDPKTAKDLIRARIKDETKDLSSHLHLFREDQIELAEKPLERTETREIKAGQY